MAVTSIQNCTKKSLLKTNAFPVASGEFIYQGALAVVDADGYLKNLTAALAAEGSKVVGFVKDGSENNNATAPSANGSISGDDEYASALSNGEKTIREIWTAGQFKITTASGLTQAMVGNTVIYATDNFTFNATGDGIPVGLLVEYISATTGYVDMNVLSTGSGTLLYRGAITAATTTTGGDAISFSFGDIVYVKDMIIDVTTAATGVATIDIGIAANGTTTSDVLFDGTDVGTAAIFSTSTEQLIAATGNAAGPAKMTATQYITGTPSATLAGLVGTFVVEYIKA